MSQALQASKALIFRIVHVDNLRWMVEHGLQCRNAAQQDPNYVSIGSSEIIKNRSNRKIPVFPYGTYSDYIPFYFTPYSIMLYNLKTGYGVPKYSNDDLLICVSSLYDIHASKQKFVYTNQHGCSGTDLKFSNDLADLDSFIDWKILRQRDFSKDPDDPGKLLRYQAEAMVQGEISLDILRGIVCHTDVVLEHLKKMVSPRYPDLKLESHPRWYF